MQKEKFNYNHVISILFIAAIFFIAGILINSLPSDISIAGIAESDYTTAELYPVSFINSTNIGVTEQDVNQLRANNPMRLKDNFNIKLSHNNFFYTDSIDVEITTDIPDAKIFYSLDGSVPAPDNGREYTDPVHFEKGDFNTSYVLKVMAYTEDDKSHLLTHTYFVSEQIGNRFTTLVFSISTDRDNLYDHEIGILVPGILREEYVEIHGRRNVNPPDPANFNLRGREGEREVYIEVFTPDGECVVSQHGGVRVHGGWSRAADRKSLRLYARNEYDPHFDKFNYEFFPDNRRKDEYQSFLNSYSSILLRNGGNDRGGSFMREEFCHALIAQAGMTDYRNYAPAAVFLNGAYYGFFWLQQGYQDVNFLDYYGGDSKSLIERGYWWEFPNPGNLMEDENFEAYSELIDIDNFMLYYAFQIYGGNRDWPHNNLQWWRFNGDGRYINQYYDGKIRMLPYDLEMSWGMYGQGTRERTIQRVRENSSSFAALTRRDDMIEKFCNQMFDLINTVLAYDNVERTFNEIADSYQTEISRAIRAQVLPNNMSNIRNEQRNILRFAEGRGNFMIEDMAAAFRIDRSDIYYVAVNGNENAAITLNTLKADGAEQLKSCYFEEHSVKLKAEPHIGYSFDYWEINGQKYYDAEIILNTRYAANSQINAILFVKSDETYQFPVINIIRLDDDFDYIELYNPSSNEFTVENLFLSNDKKELQKFRIESMKFPPESFAGYYGANYQGDETVILRVFDFKIQKGETIYLSDINGSILQEVKITKNININENEIIKRLPDGSYRIFKDSNLK